MELDFIENINEFGESVVRLYNFDKSQVKLLSSLISEIIIEKNQKLDLSTVEFIERRNCNLILGIFKTDEGILRADDVTFYCALTIDSYRKMLTLLAPFCEKETKGHQYLYDIDNPIDFLAAPAGTW